ncbi:DNA cytosine methyltransferase [Alicycliphilus denitrificans]|uniref:DNA cytosine methyltransferase n=1 Tax=Alicycliphilus denitrificans TaxID=179636 RepID=UPI0001DA0DFF|nr:DNA cytosine methyltransferase [Alicycliphilus denitrificans]ADV01307.1 C-5 cytosine-specific DNA methylase [Alicycliphilus denitrificans BC]
MKRDDFTLLLPFAHELIIDNFAGGGGTSTGLEKAFGRPVDIAINHDPEALAMHAINHPRTLHLCESVWSVDPIRVTRNQPVALVWLSPDCKHFSKAKGGTPVSRDIRGLAWVGIRWVLLCQPRVLMLENVEEFKTWGPLMELLDGTLRPDPARAGETFLAFCAMLSTGVRADHPALLECCGFLGIDPAGEMAQRLVKGLGYDIDWHELRACDHDTPTIRKRLFFVGRRDGLPIRWPEPTHGEPTSRAVLAGKLAPYRTAAECIDWEVEGTSIFGRKKDLATNTLRRVAKGLWRHVLGNPDPYIVDTNRGPQRIVDLQVSGGEPRAGVVAPFLTEHANASNQRTMLADNPLRTQCAQVKGGHFSVAAPMIAPMVLTNTTGHTGAAMDGQMPTIATGGHHALMVAHLTHLTHHGERSGTAPSIPLPTVTAAHRSEQAMVAASLVTIGYGERPGQDARAHHPVSPARTITAGGIKQGVVTAFLEQANGGFYNGDGRAADAPASTLTASGAQQRLVMAYAVKYYSNGGQWQGLGEPMHTLPTKGRMGLVQAVQVPADCVAPEHRERARLCAELLHTHLPEHFPAPAEMVLMQHEGQWWVLVDITLRMLRPRELYRAQGFPESYIIDRIPDPKLLFRDGHQMGDPLAIPTVPLSGTAQVRMCGNSVCPPVAEALARANFGHEAAIYGRAVA